MKNIRVMANFAILSDHCLNAGFDAIAKFRKKGATPTILLLQTAANEKGVCLWHMPQVEDSTGQRDSFDYEVNAIEAQVGVVCRWPEDFLTSQENDLQQRYHCGHWESDPLGVTVQSQPDLVGYGWFTYNEARNLPMSKSDQHALNLLKAQLKL